MTFETQNQKGTALPHDRTVLLLKWAIIIVLICCACLAWVCELTKGTAGLTRPVLSWTWATANWAISKGPFCQVGQGPKGAYVAQSADNSMATCDEVCRANPQCVGFDFSARAAANACRLYGKVETLRVGQAGDQIREYCSPSTAPREEGIVADSRPACRPTMSEAYTEGEWESVSAEQGDSGPNSFPYDTDADPEWHPHCDTIQNSFHSTGIRPAHLGYSWEPRYCKLDRFDKAGLCNKLDGGTVGVVGDSTSQQFVDSLVGQALGKVATKKLWSAEPRIITQELCPRKGQSVKIAWLRMDNPPPSTNSSTAHELLRLTSMSTILVMNWGVHYQSDDIASKSMTAVRDIIKQPSGPSRQLFWRETIVAHAHCDPQLTRPLRGVSAMNDSVGSEYSQGKILMQQQQVYIPVMRNLGATILRVTNITMRRPDGHRWVGHNKERPDCLHYCEPGPQDFWIQLFYNFVAETLTATSHHDQPR
jgi:hypothetical protein